MRQYPPQHSAAKQKSRLSMARRAVKRAIKNAINDAASSLAQLLPLPATHSLGKLELPSPLLFSVVGGMGDALMVGSLARHLLKRNPGLVIDALVTTQAREIIQRSVNGKVYDLRRFGVVREDFRKYFLPLRSKHYQLAFDFSHISFSAAVFLYAIGIPIRLGFWPIANSTKAHLMTHAVKLDESKSAWELYVELVRLADSNLPASVGILPVTYTKEESNHVHRWRMSVARQDGMPLIALHIGCGPTRTYRQWPIERQAALARELQRLTGGCLIVLTGSGSEKPLIDAFKSSYVGRTVDAVDWTVGQLACLLEQCDLLVSVDTGVMHLGAAMGCPTIGLFGPSSPAQWAPSGAKATYVYKTQIPCSPCNREFRCIQPRRCSNPDQSRCMWDIEPDHVLEAIRDVAGASLGAKGLASGIT
jgi:ADP-heptose:LPS heptosyltransferase